MNIFIFVGPTVPLAEAEAILPHATFLPPVAQGDLATLLRYKPDVIGIIDGYFERVPAVWHKEILLALKQGIRVIGSASMGALRAAELASFGMEGIGEIFKWYHDGIIDGDDEVAIRHMPADFGYKPMSDAMVNIRKTLHAAQQQNLLSSAIHNQLIAIAKSTYYAERTYAQIWEQAQKEGLAVPPLENVQPIDLKKADGLALLHTLAQETTPSSFVAPNFDFNLSATFARLLDRDVWQKEASTPITHQTIINHARLELPDYHQLAQQANIHDLLLHLAKLMNIQLSEAEIKTGWKKFRQQYSLTDEATYQAWLQNNHLTDDEADELVRDWLMIRRVQHIQSLQKNKGMLRELRLNGRYTPLLQTTIQKETQFNEQDITQLAKQISRTELLSFWWQHQNKKGDPPAVRTFARQHHFPNEEVLWRELLKYYIYHYQK